MLFSRVEISRFRAKAHLVFHWCLYTKRVKLKTVIPQTAVQSGELGISE